MRQNVAGCSPHSSTNSTSAVATTASGHEQNWTRGFRGARLRESTSSRLIDPQRHCFSAVNLRLEFNQNDEFHLPDLHPGHARARLAGTYRTCTYEAILAAPEGW